MFEIGLHWLPGDEGTTCETHTNAELTIRVDGHCLTQGEDRWSRTVTDGPRLSVYPMAIWLASSWWRIRYEPRTFERTQPAEWRMAHELPAAGGGYVWPPIRFWSDTDSVRVGMAPIRHGQWETMRYQPAPAEFAIPNDIFDHQVDEFVELVIARLFATGSDATELAQLWSDVCAERADPDVSAWRQMEARLGFDADAAPEWLMRAIIDLGASAGMAATAEIASAIGNDVQPSAFDDVRALAGEPGAEAVFALPAFDIDLDAKPAWEKGWLLAKEARHRLSLPAGPIDTRTLRELLGLSAQDTTAPSNASARLALGIRHDDHARATLHFRRRHPSGRRFEAARFLADHLTAPGLDHWLPLTDMATARQKRQRAFATEFLVPIDDLIGWIGDNRDDGAIEDASERYGVSPMVIERHLHNHGLSEPGG